MSNIDLTVVRIDKNIGRISKEARKVWTGVKKHTQDFRVCKPVSQE